MNIFRSGQGRTATITSLQWERKFRQSALQSNTGNFHAHVVACWQLGWLFVPAAAVRVWCSKVTCCSVPRMAAQPRPRWLLRALSAVAVVVVACDATWWLEQKKQKYFKAQLWHLWSVTLPCSFHTCLVETMTSHSHLWLCSVPGEYYRCLFNPKIEPKLCSFSWVKLLGYFIERLW